MWRYSYAVMTINVWQQELLLYPVEPSWTTAAGVGRAGQHWEEPEQM